MMKLKYTDPKCLAQGHTVGGRAKTRAQALCPRAPDRQATPPLSDCTFSSMYFNRMGF